jgi:hypothetical protein
MRAVVTNEASTGIGRAYTLTLDVRGLPVFADEASHGYQPARAHGTPPTAHRLLSSRPQCFTP